MIQLNKISKLYIFLLILSIVLALGLKYLYSVSTNSELIWILAPTAKIVEIFTGIPFVFEQNFGFLNEEHRIAVEKSCAGINYMIIVFCMSIFSFLHHIKSNIEIIYAFIVIIIASYMLAVIINAFRIITAIVILNMTSSQAIISKANMHEIIGIIFYFFSLVLYHYIIKTKIYKYQNN